MNDEEISIIKPKAKSAHKVSDDTDDVPADTMDIHKVMELFKTLEMIRDRADPDSSFDIMHELGISPKKK